MFPKIEVADVPKTDGEVVDVPKMEPTVVCEVVGVASNGLTAAVGGAEEGVLVGDITGVVIEVVVIVEAKIGIFALNGETVVCGVGKESVALGFEPNTAAVDSEDVTAVVADDTEVVGEEKISNAGVAGLLNKEFPKMDPVVLDTVVFATTSLEVGVSHASSARLGVGDGLADVGDADGAEVVLVDTNKLVGGFVGTVDVATVVTVKPNMEPPLETAPPPLWPNNDPLKALG